MNVIPHAVAAATRYCAIPSAASQVAAEPDGRSCLVEARHAVPPDFTLRIAGVVFTGVIASLGGVLGLTQYQQANVREMISTAVIAAVEPVNRKVETLVQTNQVFTERFQEIDRRFNEFDKRFERLETHAAHTDERLSRLEGAVERLGEGLRGIENRLDRVLRH